MIQTVKQEIRSLLRSLVKTCRWDIEHYHPQTLRPYRKRTQGIYDSIGVINCALSCSEHSDDATHEIMYIKLWDHIKKVMPTGHSRKHKLRQKAIKLYYEIIGETDPLVRALSASAHSRRSKRIRSQTTKY